MSSETQSCPEAIERLQSLFNEASQRATGDATATSLATATPSGRPSIRMVTVVTIDDRGAVFFTDMRSGNGQQLNDNPQAALCFYWPELHQQIVVEGSVARREEAQANGRTGMSAASP